VGRCWGRGAVSSHDASERFEWVALGSCVLSRVPALERLCAAVGAWCGGVVGVAPSLIADRVITVASGSAAMCVVFVVGHGFPLSVLSGPPELHPNGLSRSLLLWSVVSFHPTYGGVGLVETGAISSVIPVNRRPRTNLAGRGIPRHSPFMVACFGRRTRGNGFRLGAS